MNSKISFYIKNINEMLPNDSSISKELIFFLKDRLGLSDTSIFLDEYNLSNKEEDLIKEFIDLKSQGLPLDYVLQNTSFYKDDFYVDRRVLVPRPETELLVDYVNGLNLKPGMKILDAGTGSGCIGISIAKYNPSITVYGIDYSLDALEVAQINKKNKLLDNFYLINSDWLKCIQERTINILVSNPPYIAPSDPHLENLKYEPIKALVADDNGLKDFKRITKQAKNVLSPDGILVFEHGYNQSMNVENILIESGFKNIYLMKDHQSQPRITTARLA
ncbi:peptide chain release factor N(5)-glutamine methyltransferase [Gammaproteobacteria bacterium]|nr:peptide chain release factor N(5)-glutamine methyltransferase [Gammaproteobacteria bacterium]